MSLLKKLQARLLKRDIEKGKNAHYLATKYPMSLLLQNGAFVRLANTELYVPNGFNEKLYNIKGEYLGTQCVSMGEDISSNIVVRKNDGKFENGTENTSYAVCDKFGNYIVPHSCYSKCFRTADYAILSTEMKCPQRDERESRIENNDDLNRVMESTGLSLKDTLGGSTKNPRTLIVSNNKITATNYLSVQPLRVYGELDVYANNTVWISQNQKEEEITFKLDKNLKVLETYKFPLYAHLYEMFFMDNKTNAVYFLDTENKRRINLRTGAYVNLLNLKRAHLSKKERFAGIEEQNADNIVDDMIEEEIENVDSVCLEEVVDGLIEEADAEEQTEEIVDAEQFEDLSVVGDDEIGEYDPSLDEIEDSDKIIVLGDCVMSVGPNADVFEQAEEVVEESNNECAID